MPNQTPPETRAADPGDDRAIPHLQLPPNQPAASSDRRGRFAFGGALCVGPPRTDAALSAAAGAAGLICDDHGSHQTLQNTPEEDLVKRSENAPRRIADPGARCSDNSPRPLELKSSKVPSLLRRGILKGTQLQRSQRAWDPGGAVIAHWLRIDFECAFSTAYARQR